MPHGRNVNLHHESAFGLTMTLISLTADLENLFSNGGSRVDHSSAVQVSSEFVH